MFNFKDLGIKPKTTAFIGDKIKIDKILNKVVTVLKFKIDDSVKKPGTKYLTLQIELNKTKYVVFSGSTILIGMIEQVPEDKFPFDTTIVKDNEYLEFT